ncbi:MAG: type II secretion system protein [bacterium]
MKTSKGFTLIELLVVIAIIGILSSVVLASLTTARAKGQDAAVQSQLSSMRSQAELYYSSNSNTYASAATNVCTAATSLFANTTTGNLTALLAGAAKSAGGTGAGDTTVLKCTATTGATSGWAVTAKLPSGTTGATHFCVDSSGKAVTEPAFQADGVVTCA